MSALPGLACARCVPRLLTPHPPFGCILALHVVLPAIPPLRPFRLVRFAPPSRAHLVTHPATKCIFVFTIRIASAGQQRSIKTQRIAELRSFLPPPFRLLRCYELGVQKENAELSGTRVCVSFRQAFSGNKQVGERRYLPGNMFRNFDLSQQRVYATEPCACQQQNWHCCNICFVLSTC